MAKSLSQTLLIASVLSLGALGFTSLDAEAAPRGPNAAQHDRGGKGHKGAGKARMVVKAASQLDLNADQQATVDKVKAEMQAAREARKGARGERGERGERLEGILDGSVSEAQVHAMIDERAAQKTAKAHQDAEWVFEVLDVLSAEQKQELKGIIQERRAQRGAAGSGGPAGGPRAKGKRGRR
jgi:Spy/CpxP family protein refolding chaperone